MFEVRDGIYVKGYGFLWLSKNIGKNLSNKYSQKLLDSTKKSVTIAIKAGSKRVIQKTAETTGELVGSKIADKIVKVWKTSKNNLEAVKTKEDIPKERYLQKKGNNLLIN